MFNRFATRTGGAALALTLTFAGGFATASAQDDASAEGERVILRFAGGSAWRVECQLMKDDGDMSRPSAKGRGAKSTGSISAFDVVSGVCDVTAGSRGPLRVTLDERSGDFKCPFGEPAEGARCEAVYPASAKAQFEIALP